MSKNSKLSRGGIRPGSGPKKKPPTGVMSFRHDEMVIADVRKKYKPKELAAKGKAFLNKLAKKK